MTPLLALLAALACLATPALAGDPRIASTDTAEVCASDGRPGSAYSRQHRVVHRAPTPGLIKDHVIPLCAGGADVDANIQLQTPEDAAEKDRLERFACIAVCRNHTIGLAEAQSWFADWRAQMWRVGR